MMKLNNSAILFFSLAFFIVFFVLKFKSPILLHSNKKIKIIEKRKPLLTLKLSVVGDLMCHSPQFNSARTAKPDSFDFRSVFSEIRQYIESADFALGNLETVIAGNNENLSGYPDFNSPPAFLTALKYAGFDILFTANNHFLDQGFNGALRTIKKIHEKKLTQIGTYISQKDRDSVRIFKKNGISFALLAYTFGTNNNSVTKKKRFIINKINKNEIHKDLLDANKLLPDLVIVYFHFGNEYQAKPSAFQKEIVKFAIANGADIVLGSHPHVLQPIEKFKSTSGRIDSAVVAYSLGNFISNQRWRYSDTGGILNIVIKKNIITDSVFISKISFLSTWVYKGKINNKTQFKILPAGNKLDTLKFLSREDLRKIKDAFRDTRKIISSKDKSIKILYLNNK